jgi:hypothetical protein
LLIYHFAFTDFYRIAIRLASQTVARNSRTCHDLFYIERLFFHAALISAVFIRLLPALLVAPRNFAPRIFVSLHCFLLRRPPARPAGLSAFRSDRFCSPGVRRREQSRSLIKRNAKT